MMRQACFCPYNKCDVHVFARAWERRRKGGMEGEREGGKEGGEFERRMRVDKEKEQETEEREVVFLLCAHVSSQGHRV